MMLRQIAIAVTCVFSFSSFAITSSCGQALLPSEAGFCSSFKSIAGCHCNATSPIKNICGNMNGLYSYMLAMFYGSLQKACAYQKDTNPQTCIDSWNCYRLGGRDSQNRLCSGN